MAGNITVSTCCLGGMAVNAPRPRAAPSDWGEGGAFAAISPSQTSASYYLAPLLPSSLPFYPSPASLAPYSIPYCIWP